MGVTKGKYWYTHNNESIFIIGMKQKLQMKQATSWIAWLKWDFNFMDRTGVLTLLVNYLLYKREDQNSDPQSPHPCPVGMVAYLLSQHSWDRSREFPRVSWLLCLVELVISGLIEHVKCSEENTGHYMHTSILVHLLPHRQACTHTYALLRINEEGNMPHTLHNCTAISKDTLLIGSAMMRGWETSWKFLLIPSLVFISC